LIRLWRQPFIGSKLDLRPWQSGRRGRRSHRATCRSSSSKEGKMRAKVASLLVAASTAVVIAACAELPLESPVADSVLRAEGPRLSMSALLSGEVATSTFDIDPAKATVYTDGISTVTIPAGAVCDPATSSYGPTEWDRPCTPISAPLTVAVTLSAENGRLTLDFSPDLRFVPHPTKQIVLEMRIDAVKSAKDARRFAIFWVPTGERRLVDEGRTDPTLRTQVFKNEGRLVRRLKHFSGYNVYSGVVDDCSPDENPDWCRPLGEVQEQ
jgi:hypothetical protein